MNTTKRPPVRRAARGSNGSSSSATLSLSAAEKVLGMSVTMARGRHSRLTERERQVAALMGEGRPNRQIAERLGISPKTLDIHRANVMHKLEAPTSARVANLVNLLRLADIAG
jgi:DNA-binding CsgD family transcriptional regulator